MTDYFMIYVKYYPLSERYYVRAVCQPTPELAAASDEAKFTGVRRIRGDPYVIPHWLEEKDFAGLPQWHLTPKQASATNAA